MSADKTTYGVRVKLDDPRAADLFKAEMAMAVDELFMRAGYYFTWKAEDGWVNMEIVGPFKDSREWGDWIIGKAA